MASDQKNIWNNLHHNRSLDTYSTNPTDFAKRVITLFPKEAKILDLGCGLGNDSVFFAEKGYKILATDFSDIVVKENSNKYQNSNLKFEVLDIKNLSSLKDQSFDIVYARLSLHYFSDSETKIIFKEISRILKNNGLLAFICKSTKDPLYGKGDKLEEDMYSYKNHIRHFFSKDYTEKLLKKDFVINSLTEGQENLYGHDSAFIEVIATKK